MNERLRDLAVKRGRKRKSYEERMSSDEKNAHPRKGKNCQEGAELGRPPLGSKLQSILLGMLRGGLTHKA